MVYNWDMPNLKQFKNREDFNKWYSDYRKKKKWVKYHREYIRKWRKENGTYKDAQRKKVSYAVRTGKIKKLPCKVCGYEIVEAHHEDYSKPLEVIWLCREHHRIADIKLSVRED